MLIIFAILTKCLKMVMNKVSAIIGEIAARNVSLSRVWVGGFWDPGGAGDGVGRWEWEDGSALAAGVGAPLPWAAGEGATPTGGREFLCIDRSGQLYGCAWGDRFQPLCELVGGSAGEACSGHVIEDTERRASSHHLDTIANVARAI